MCSHSSTSFLFLLTLYLHFLSPSVFLSSVSSCVGRSSASCAWLRTDRRTRCSSARNSSRKTAGKSERLPRTKSWSWNCTQSVCGQMDECLSDGERPRESENEQMFCCSFHCCKVTVCDSFLFVRSRVNHPNILQLIDTFETRKEYFIIQELWVFLFTVSLFIFLV